MAKFRGLAIAAFFLLVAHTSSAGVASRIPLYFERNEGQAGREVDYLSRGNGYSLELSATESLTTVAKAGKMVRSRMQIVGGNRAARAEGVDHQPGKVNYLLG